MWLPSGRPLRYLRPRLEVRPTPWGEKRLQITYEGLNDRKQWVRMHTTPGKVTENADQAISRDLLVHGMKLAQRRGIDLRLHVHDQLVGLAKEDEADAKLALLMECMNETPRWAEGLPLGSAGQIAKVMIKD
jgi:DNA polymerase